MWKGLLKSIHMAKNINIWKEYKYKKVYKCKKVQKCKNIYIDIKKFSEEGEKVFEWQLIYE